VGEGVFVMTTRVGGTVGVLASGVATSGREDKLQADITAVSKTTAMTILRRKLDMGQL
jgi:hypothetical protein